MVTPATERRVNAYDRLYTIHVLVTLTAAAFLLVVLFTEDADKLYGTYVVAAYYVAIPFLFATLVILIFTIPYIRDWRVSAPAGLLALVVAINHIVSDALPRDVTDVITMGLVAAYVLVATAMSIGWYASRRRRLIEADSES